jgi:hypothetical protein
MGQQIIEHGGRVWGFVARITRYPDDHATIIVQSNYDDIGPEMITEDLEAIVFEQK